ncbi:MULTISPECIES: hypothetical protein [unclassified Mesorhizobium]|uniref:hypothetical protein n=1 Tax=unclassified Mesorhizobium TaxID=325217 RepID=UPI001CCC867F|nr:MULTISPECIES: hypothetical protein [unclassified Mesorhizobium]MBZ9743173.1 hypothetical protein [Mesorhizobium sp. CO1-1-4]MBZ9801791.1 hypothetical protein [Mesorhizobium sp. ES1-6]
MAELKSARHHWWPEGVSSFWKDKEGFTNWLLPDGSVKRMPPKNLGAIGNGHQIRLGQAGEATPFDQDFENVFARADDNFPSVIRWLQGLERDDTPRSEPFATRFRPADASDENLAMLAEGLISLAVRSPMNRQGAVSVAEQFRGSLPEAERNALIGLNMRNTHQEAVKQIGINGKFVAIYSPTREFIFGDGFYHNIRSPLNVMHSPTLLVPLTPNIAALFVRPMSYRTLPRFFTLVISDDEAERLNHAIQVHARKQIFYRADRPTITDAYSQERHLVYTAENPVKDLVESIPGVGRPIQRFFLSTDLSVPAALKPTADDQDQRPQEKHGVGFWLGTALPLLKRCFLIN